MSEQLTNHFVFDCIFKEMNYTFNNVDPTKKHKRKGWIDKLAPGISFKKKKISNNKRKTNTIPKIYI